MLLAFNHWAPLSLFFSSFLFHRFAVASPIHHNAQPSLDLRPQQIDLVAQMDAGSGGGGTAEPAQNGTPPGGNSYVENEGSGNNYDDDDGSTFAPPQVAAVQSQNSETAQPQNNGQDYDDDDEDITTRQAAAEDYETPQAGIGLPTTALNPLAVGSNSNGGAAESTPNGIFGGANGMSGGGAATTAAIWNPIGGNTVAAVWNPSTPVAVLSGGSVGSVGSNVVPVGSNGAPILGGAATTAAQPWYDRWFIQNDPNLAKQLPKTV